MEDGLNDAGTVQLVFLVPVEPGDEPSDHHRV
ncbi:MAG: hypothetical protein ACJAV2_004971, partial [Myxococcota bacterium]